MNAIGMCTSTNVGRKEPGKVDKEENTIDNTDATTNRNMKCDTNGRNLGNVGATSNVKRLVKKAGRKFNASATDTATQHTACRKPVDARADSTTVNRGKQVQKVRQTTKKLSAMDETVASEKWQKKKKRSKYFSASDVSICS